MRPLAIGLCTAAILMVHTACVPAEMSSSTALYKQPQPEPSAMAGSGADAIGVVPSAAKNPLVDLDDSASILEYIAQNTVPEGEYTQTLADGYSDQYLTRELTATVEISAFSGVCALMELELNSPATVGFTIAADVAGDYKIAVISQSSNLLLTASSYQWQQASRPIEVPAGPVAVFLVGEQATGALQVTLQPPASTVVCTPQTDALDQPVG